MISFLCLIIFRYPSAKIYASTDVSFADRLWSPLMPGLAHISLSLSLKTQFSRQHLSKLSKEALDTLTRLQNIVSDDIQLEIKLSQFPPSCLVFTLLQDVGELVSSESSAWDINVSLLTGAKSKPGSFRAVKKETISDHSARTKQYVGCRIANNSPLVDTQF